MCESLFILIFGEDEFQFLGKVVLVDRLEAIRINRVKRAAFVEI